jgi:hypothetical protein
MITRAIDAFNRGELLNEFIPVPEDLKITSGFLGDPEEQKKLEESQQRNVGLHGYKDWYDFSVNEWGTKWDVGGNGAYNHMDEHMVSFSFDSAWSPPTPAYEKLQELGFDVEAMYYEPGMAFCGVFDECGDDFYDMSNMNSNEVRDAIPTGLDAEFGISESIEEYENENEDEVTTWYKDGVEATGLTPHTPPKK